MSSIHTYLQQLFLAESTECILQTPGPITLFARTFSALGYMLNWR